MRKINQSSRQINKEGAVKGIQKTQLLATHKKQRIISKSKSQTIGDKNKESKKQSKK